MFSKLHTYGESAATILSAADLPFGDQAVLEPVSGGTSGVCYIATVNGRRRFLKTHRQSSDARANLAKEIMLLEYLEGDNSHVEHVRMGDGRLWLIMDELSPADPSPEEIRQLTATCETRLAEISDLSAMRSEENFTCLLLESERAFTRLVERRTLSLDLQQTINSYFKLLREAAPLMRPRVCHGDLGPRNLMLHGSRLLAIDWEDAFWGVEGYDYLYWLTFFGNRRYLGPGVFDHTPWGKGIEIAILLMILVIKCDLSLRNGTHLSNSLSFEERLAEVIAHA